MERYALGFFCLQSGGGLYISGAATLTNSKATLTNSNVYDNDASRSVCSLLNISSIAPYGA